MPDRVLTVTQLSEYIKMLLDADKFLRSVCVRGEISNLKNYSGTLYFSLKDHDSVVNLVMYSSYTSKMRFVPKDGMNVIVSGYVSAYAKFGRYQLYANDMQPDGVGALYLAYEQLKEKLAREGLFDESKKRSVPKYPSAIGVVTSPKGAVIHDIINVAGRRCRGVKIILYPSLVQGEGAERQLAEGIRFFNSDKAPKVETLIIGRGGGSIEDLWAFNSEELAREIRRSKIPVISAVGHETDFTICDLASDLRAPTPSAAAEIAVPSEEEMRARITGDLEALADSVSDMTEGYRERLERLARSEVLASPLAYVDSRRKDLSELEERLGKAISEKHERGRERTANLARMLSAVSPLGVLSRGYGLVLDEGGKAVKSVGDVKKGDKISIRLSDGELKAEINGKKTGNGDKKDGKTENL